MLATSLPCVVYGELLMEGLKVGVLIARICVVVLACSLQRFVLVEGMGRPTQGQTSGCNDTSLSGQPIRCTSVSVAVAAQIDDPAGAFSIHGLSGIWGMLFVGLLAK